MLEIKPYRWKVEVSLLVNEQLISDVWFLRGWKDLNKARIRAMELCQLHYNYPVREVKVTRALPEEIREYERRSNVMIGNIMQHFFSSN